MIFFRRMYVTLAEWYANMAYGSPFFQSLNCFMGREQSVQIYLVTIEMQKPATIEIGPFPPLIMRGFSTRFYILDNRFFFHPFINGSF